MADLKQGTTVGGNTIWTQGNLPLIPAGDFISYKGFKVYTSNDKPTATDLGFLPAAGGIVTGNLEVKGSTTVGNGTVSGILVFTRSDTNIQFTSANKDTLSVNYSTAGNFGIWNTTQAKWSMYRGITNEQWIFNDTGGVRVNNTLNVLGNTTLATTTTGDLTSGALSTTTISASGKITGASGMTLNSANAGIEMGSLSVVGAPYIDFHTSGTNVDYDIRLSANTTSVSIISPSTLTNFNLQTTQFLRLHSGMTCGIKMSRDSTIIRDHYNGNVSISASKRSDTEEIGGDIYLGYDATGYYTNSVRLEKKLTWKGINDLVDANGKLVGASLDTAYLPLTGGTLNSNLVVNGTIGASGNVNAGSFSTPGGATIQGLAQLNAVTTTDLVSVTGSLRTRSASNCHVWFENNTGAERALIWADTNNNLNFRSTSGLVQTSMRLDVGGGIWSKNGDISTFSVDATQNCHVWFKNTDGANRAIIFANKDNNLFLQPSGGWVDFSGAKLNSIATINTNGLITTAGGLTSSTGWITTNGRVSGGETWSQGNLVAGNGTSVHAPDGNISGSSWGGGWLSNWIEARADAYAVQRTNAFMYSQDANYPGTIAFARVISGTAVGYGGLIPGSSLRPCNISGGYDINNALPGTWLCTGSVAAGGSGDGRWITTFKRVG